MRVLGFWMSQKAKKVVLCVLDGWGIGRVCASNAIAAAHTPNFDRFLSQYPHTTLNTSGLSVGLPEGQMGNSEVGHMTIGSGRIIYQDLPKINQALSNGTLSQLLKPLAARVLQTTGTCHVMGLLSDGGVHSHEDHFLACALALKDAGVNVNIHAFLDGRDVPPQSAATYIQALESAISHYPNVTIQTLSGRYHAMDRDHRWERIEKAFQAIVWGKSEGAFTDPLKALQASYDDEITDEFLTPSCRSGYQGMHPMDGILAINFRADRVVQLLASLSDPSFASFERNGFQHLGPACGMTAYSQALRQHFVPLFFNEPISDTLGEIVSKMGFKQYRIAETEKFAHVTYFLNAGQEQAFDREQRILIPSPKVPHYDLQPEMSASEVTDALVTAMQDEEARLIVVNYANADMVGHTGQYEAAIKAIETLDVCLGAIEAAALDQGWYVLITADHGNAECMVDAATHEPHTAHTTNVVPCVLLHPALVGNLIAGGGLQDVAPTILDLMEIPAPCVMTGQSLLSRGYNL